MALSLAAGRTTAGASCSGRPCPAGRFSAPDVAWASTAGRSGRGSPSAFVTAAVADDQMASMRDFAQHAPLALERVVYACSSQNCGDQIYRSTLDPALRMEGSGVNPLGVGLVVLAFLYLTAAPGVLQGFLDTYLLAPVRAVTDPEMREEDVVVGRKLAVGGFGTVYMGTAARAIPGLVRKGQKIIVKKATEFGEAEVWMNERLARAAPQTCAKFLTAYSDGPSTKPGTPLVLVWLYEGPMTLAAAMGDRFFPFNVERQLLGRELKISSPVERRLVSTKVIMQQLLQNLQGLHETGIVHRDVKPQNMILSELDGRLKLIDLGAAADLRIGINYVPNEYLLDPRFAPPQQYIMSPLTPTAPAAPIAALLCPVLWRLNQPDRFDMYSAGIVMMQLVFASLRSDAGIIAFNSRLEEVDYDLEAWRASITPKQAPVYKEGLALLDAEDGSGWELVCRLVTFKPSGRYSASQALQHPWFSTVGTVAGTVNALASAANKAVDSAIKTIDSDGSLERALSGNRDSFSEATLWDALDKDAAESDAKAPPPMSSNPPRTIAWWQKREGDKKGVLGKVLAKARGNSRDGQSAPALARAAQLAKNKPKSKRILGAATQRAYAPVKNSDGKARSGKGTAKVKVQGEDSDSSSDGEAPPARKGKKLFSNLFGKR